MFRIVVNARSLGAPLTGVQRYTRELLSRWNGHTDQITPRTPLSGIRGHAWEQSVLPRKLASKLLFSPSNSGPLEVRNQVVTIHDMVYFDHPETLNRNFVAWYRFMLPRLARRVRRVITVSSFVKRRIVEQVEIPSEKIVVIPNGVSSRFSPKAVSGRDAAIAQMGIPSTHYILALGSIEPRKNLSRLLRAWEGIQSSLPDDLWLVVAGARGNSGIFKTVDAGKLPPRVFLTGHVSDETLPSLVAGAVAMAYPSLYEGFGLPALEAMASGVPVLAGDCPAIREVVDGAGIFVDPMDEASIADGLLRLVNDDAVRNTLRTKGLERATQFSWDVTAQRTWDVLQEAAKEGS